VTLRTTRSAATLHLRIGARGTCELAACAEAAPSCRVLMRGIVADEVEMGAPTRGESR
jgi:hypothetical protein